MNILLIGGAGFIGSALCHRLIEDDEYRLFVFEPEQANIGRLVDIEDKVTVVRGSLADVDGLKNILKDNSIDTVAHLVSTLIPGSSYEDYKLEFENVIFPSARLMQYCAEEKIKFVFFSSGGTIYGDSMWGRFREQDSPSPISYYGLSKQMLEDSVLFEHRRGKLDYLIIRPSNPYGKGQNLYGKQGLIAVLIGKVLNDEPIEIWGDGSSVRDYIYIDDLADSVYQLLKNNVSNRIVNIGSGHGYSVNTIIQRLQNVIKKEIKVIYKESRSVDVNAMVLDIAILRKLTNVKHTHLEDGLRAFYEYACKHRK